jgi:hypothetical protein
MAKPVELPNGRSWPTKKAAEQHFREILARYSDGDTVSDYNDHTDLAALLERFDTLVADGPSKIGAGIERFERRLNRGDGWSSPGFWVVRIDDSETDFSYVKAVSGKPMPEAQEFYAACHNAVAADLLRLKQHQFDHFADDEGRLACDATDALITFSEAQLAHANPRFGAIVNAFREHKGWSPNFPAGLMTMAGDAQLSTSFADPEVAGEFREYHHKIAVLRIVSKARPPGSAHMTTAIKRPLRLS